ncbi:MAG TPA: choice-of-anchor P family protein [Terriglobales bacterium]|jgi:hypothetical protein|nr:choice-of-anchor P family protein [Terriglobales bacterium]
MRQASHSRLTWGAAAFLLAALLAWPATTQAQLGGLLPPLTSPTTTTVNGDAAAVRATLLGVTTTLSDTGTLTGPNDARDASMTTGSVPSLLAGETLHAVTLGWPDEVDSEAALSNLNLNVAGVGISADLVMSRASQVLGAPSQGSSVLNNLTINGMPISVTGLPNQTVAIPGGQVILNEQSVSSTGAMVVNAVHVVINGVADVAIASATAGVS